MSLSRLVELIENRLMTKKTVSVTIGAAATEGTVTFEHRGVIFAYQIVTPNYTNAVTTTITITDPDGYEVYSLAAIAENLTTFVNELSNKVPCDGIMTITITLSGVPGTGGGDTSVKLHLR